MKRCGRAALFALLLAAGTGQATYAACAPEAAFLSFKASILELSDRAQFDNSVPSEVVKDLTEHTILLQKIADSGNVKFPQTYCRALQLVADELYAASTSGDAEQLKRVASGALEDMRIKIDYLTASMQFAAPVFEVKVTVRTLHGGKDSNGYLTGVNMLLFPDGPPLFTFPESISPTTQVLPPGRYVLRAQKGGTVACERTVEVGLNREREQTISCPVP